MFREVIGALGFMKWPPAMKFPIEIPVNFQNLTDLSLALGNFVWSDPSGTFVFPAACSFVVLSLPAWLIYFKKKKKIDDAVIAPMITRSDVAGDSPEELTFEPGDNYEYAENLQLQEAVLASILASQIENRATTSVQGGLIMDIKPVEVENEVMNSHTSFCEICLENRESWQMFTNGSCSHSFCYDCTSKHIMSRIEDKVKIVICPALNCNTVLDADICRLMIPNDAIIRWDESLCQSLIPESQKVYCPFNDCSAMFVNDSRALITEVKCLVCHRSFCAKCRVPWHPEFTCREFQKLYSKRGGKDEVMVKTLAKKKSWQRCPKCKMYVEKSDGCIHITCRCKYEFCYRCGSKWTGSGSHSGCHRNG
ncbi:probable E3 ubiquitin- ligase RNF217 [Olea europaea subsp. europaea]|uniref:RBR-type E3 ubiquitin transferase n=1 Tax=Olea europaea subsp. europaea TaxID=158383 RepID=A0A8S0TQE3_OLEEU|nr:probable E3 ubiquitin- ligase RNF217 [Olea europaea subsp. europaea]